MVKNSGGTSNIYCPSISDNDLHIHDNCCSPRHPADFVADSVADFVAAVVAAAQVYEAFLSALDCHCSAAAAVGLPGKQQVPLLVPMREYPMLLLLGRLCPGLDFAADYPFHHSERPVAAGTADACWKGFDEVIGYLNDCALPTGIEGSEFAALSITKRVGQIGETP